MGDADQRVDSTTARAEELACSVWGFASLSPVRLLVRELRGTYVFHVFEKLLSPLIA